ncbi:MAG TPA: 7TM diverse intracellular signaling domain-containing protein [Chitinophagaceae bacterium]|nr:7TM diverse intracellular signaling domain-containing protein [Chitinophagaceae bacterium]
MIKLHPAWYLGIIFLLLQNLSYCQQKGDSSHMEYIDISNVVVVKPISEFVSSCFTSKDYDLIEGYKNLKFSPSVIYKGTVPAEKVTQKLLLQLHVTNTADSIITINFFPGFYYKEIKLYRLKNGRLSVLPAEFPAIPDSIGFRQFLLTAHDSATIIAELSFVRTYINLIRPRLVSIDQASIFISSIRNDRINIHMFTYIFCGLLLMMVLYSVANYLQVSNKEFLYYSGYALFLGGMLFTKALFDQRTNFISYFIESYLDFIMQCVGIIFYMIFMQKYLDTKNKYPFLYRLYNIGVLLLLISLISYTFLHYFTDNFSLQNTVENATKIFLLVLVVIFLVYSARHRKDRLLRFLFWGNFFLFIFSLISQIAVLQEPIFKSFPGVFRSALFYYETGLFLELVFFLAALNYKNRRQIIDQTKEREMLKAKTMMQEYEKELAVLKAQQQERERISADMHDELGAGMTAIRLMSEIAKNKMKESTPVEIDKISNSANDVLNKMNAIIWSMNSGNDSLDSLVSYIRSYAQEYFDNTPILCKVITPEEIPSLEISGDKRRNLFLAIKETLNNTLKHSGASKVIIEVTIEKEQLVLKISDDGKGIDLENLRQFGNGLKNIQRRMESIGGKFSIQNNEGTISTFHLPL